VQPRVGLVREFAEDDPVLGPEREAERDDDEKPVFEPREAFQEGRSPGTDRVGWWAQLLTPTIGAFSGG